MYQCKRCGYTSPIKGNLKNHFKRKRICKPILQNIEIETLMEELEILDNTKKPICVLEKNPPKESNEIETTKNML